VKGEYIESDTMIDRLIDRQTYTERERERKIERETDRLRDGETDRQRQT
jgi:hypothetical protein